MTMVSKWEDERWLKMVKPSHYDHLVDQYCCGCTGCEAWRAARVLPGRLCRPATRDPAKTAPGTVPAWPMNNWSKVGWDFRLEANAINRVMVLGYVDEDDRPNAGHLDCVVIMTHKPGSEILVTSRKWLVALA